MVFISRSYLPYYFKQYRNEVTLLWILRAQYPSEVPVSIPMK